ncbi:MAG: site-2 protease family protein [Nevskia sp.]|nr:site-2 protease family protein [Nevskia sp.]
MSPHWGSKAPEAAAPGVGRRYNGLMSSLTLVQRLAVYALPLILALTVREMVRGRVAFRLGDTTGQQLGRLSLNPLHHIDPLGTLLLPGMMLALSSAGLGGILIGWPKLIPIDLRKLREPRRDLGLIAVSGLAANLVMALLWGVVLKVALMQGEVEEGVWLGIRLMAVAGITLNAGFFVLNLLPIPPFDGGRVLLSLLPARHAVRLAAVEPYSFFILLALMVTNLISVILVPPMLLVVRLIFTVLAIDAI